MSAASKITLAATAASAVCLVTYVHYGQMAEKAAMHEGVLRDVETRQRKQREQQERLLDFQQQAALEKEYRKVQQVSDEKSNDEA